MLPECLSADSGVCCSVGIPKKVLDSLNGLTEKISKLSFSLVISPLSIEFSI